MTQYPATDKKSKTTPKNAIEFDKSYRVMDLRLLRGWSAYELSWLLGYRDLYVRDVENPLHGLQYAPEDTNYLRLIFGCGYDAIIAAKLEPPVWNISVDSSTNENGLTEHQVYLSPLSRKKKKPSYPHQCHWQHYPQPQQAQTNQRPQYGYGQGYAGAPQPCLKLSLKTLATSPLT